MEPWYKVTMPRAEVREGRSFNPDEFAIALEQVVAGTAPEDYRDARKFFDRTCFTRALNEQLGLVLRRLDGETQGTPPVLSMITQFGGGKTHTLTALYHLVKHPKESAGDPGVQSLLKSGGLTRLPAAKVAVFVGNAWDPAEGKETPWIDMARQVAGAAGVEALGPKARTSPPGTDSLQKVFQAAGGRVMLLFDEVLNFFNRHRDMAEPFYAFLDNVVRAMTGAPGCAAMLSLPRSPVEMTDFDQMWLDRIDKIVHRVAKDLIANDEGEISEVVRRRLFEDLGKDSVRKAVAKAYADWCFDRRAQLPPEWTAVDTITTDAKAREHLRARFEAAYPFHPATISVFQRKWQGLPHYQRTRGTLAMFAQWISWAGREAFRYARKEPLITLGSAPLHVPEFQAAILGQLGEQRLLPAIEVDIAGDSSHARALDASRKGNGSLVDIHRRVGTAILFESTGVATDKAAHLPELRFALGEPDSDSTSVDNAAIALEKRAFFIRRVGTDGYRIGYKPTLKKIVGDRKAGLDEGEVAKAIRNCVREQFEKGRSVKLESGATFVLPWEPLVTNGDDVPDTPRLTLVVADPDLDWDEEGETRKKVASWTHTRGNSQRFYLAALVWIIRKPGKSLREKAEQYLAWKRVAGDLSSGLLGTDFDATERTEVTTSIREAEGDLQGEVWASYRYLITADPSAADGLRVIDLGAGHSSGGVSLGGRVIAALKAEGLLNESVGAGYIERNWPPALKESGAWPLNGLRQAFLDGSLIRLPEPEAELRRKIVGFVERGDFGLGSGPHDGGFERVWWKETIGPEEVLFDGKTFLMKAPRAAELQKATQGPAAAAEEQSVPGAAHTPSELVLQPPPVPAAPAAGPAADAQVHLALRGPVPPEQWNRLGTRLLPKLRTAGTDLSLSLDASLTVSAKDLQYVEAEIRQALRDLGLESLVRVEKG